MDRIGSAAVNEVLFPIASAGKHATVKTAGPSIAASGHEFLSSVGTGLGRTTMDETP